MRKWNRNLILAWSIVAIMVIATVVFIIVYSYSRGQENNENAGLKTQLVENIKNRQDNDVFSKPFNDQLFNVLNQKHFDKDVSKIVETKILYQIAKDGEEHMGFYFVFKNDNLEIKNIFDFIIDRNGIFQSLKEVA